MLVAFKTHAANPKKISLVLDKMPWQVETISDEVSESYRNTGWSVMTQQDYDAYILSCQSEQDAYDQEQKNKNLKIIKLVQSEFKHYHPSKIDFTMHLITNTLLEKKVTMAANGRPSVAKYYYPDSSLEDNLMCEIKFEFIDNSSKFMVERKEWLGYYNGDNTVPEYYLIHHRKYNFNVVKEAAESLQERVDARSNIIQEVKIVVHNGILMDYITKGKSVAEANLLAIQDGGAFFNQYRTQISNFIEVADPSLKNIVLSDTSHNFLNLYVAPNVTARQYFYGRLNY